MDEDRLAGVRAVVTGGGSGIGLAIARKLHALGATLVLMGRNAARLEAALATLAAPGHQAFVCDVGDPKAIADAFARLDERPLHVLVNNAGVARSAKFADTSTALWDEMLRVNLSGVFHCTRAALPRLLAAPFGRVVNVASTAGLIGYPMVSAYCAAKHGVIGLTRSLALECARTQVTVNAVCPGYADTDMTTETVANLARATGRAPEEARAMLARRNPQRRLIAPDEVADTVAWLCQPSSQAITGQAIAVAGGEVM
jgi:NAD(P)-dependent dehydrogenase (short-subunit alcohol dehydrogenase family)